jgi:hypothetical protein
MMRLEVVFVVPEVVDNHFYSILLVLLGSLPLSVALSYAATATDAATRSSNLPLVTVAEFKTILKSSSKSVQQVELFSYIKGRSLH